MRDEDDRRIDAQMAAAEEMLFQATLAAGAVAIRDGALTINDIGAAVRRAREAGLKPEPPWMRRMRFDATAMSAPFEFTGTAPEPIDPKQTVPNGLKP